MTPQMSPGTVRMPNETIETVQQTATSASPKLRSTDLNFFYGTYQALHGISLAVESNKVTALIGPSGCGKSTFLRTLNRMNETVKGSKAVGKILLDNENILEMEVSH